MEEYLELEITGMSCDSCARHVVMALKRLEEVESAEIPSWKEKNQYDLMIIGGGAAGFSAAIKASEMGFKAAIVEESTIGGTCVNVGCVPSKILIKAVGEYYHASHPGFNAVKTGWSKLSWRTLIKEKDNMIEQLRKSKYIEVLGSYPDIDYIKGKAKLKGGNIVEINGDEYRPHKILISTGASPRIPPISGLRECEYLTSTTAMELKELPSSMIILGANVVGLEFAQLFARAGVEVILVELAERIAPDMEPEISEELEKVFKNEGVEILTGMEVEHIERKIGGRYVSTCRRRDAKEENTFILEAEKLLVATGRRANTLNMGLDSSGVKLGDNGEIMVDETLRTSNSSVYAAGDVTGSDMFVYTAAYSGSIAAENALTDSNKIYDIQILPRVIFTEPQVASVGMRESEAIDKGIDIETGLISISNVPIAIASKERHGLVKIVAEKGTGRILGVHMLSNEAGSVIEIAAMAMKAGLGIEELKSALFPYLTYSEGLKIAAIAMKKDIDSLSCCAV